MQTLNTQFNSSLFTTIGFEELGISLVANQIDPAIFKLEFLKIIGIIPLDWELQTQPILANGFAEFVFENGVTLVVQSRSITFHQRIDINNNYLKIPKLLQNFVEKLPYAEYQNLSINPKILVGFPHGEDTGRQFIIAKLLSPGSWSNLGVAPARAAVNFFFELERCKLVVNLGEAQIQQADIPPMSGLLFSGTFNYEVASHAAGVQRIKLLLENCSLDLEDFRQIVNYKFLGQQESVFPI